LCVLEAVLLPLTAVGAVVACAVVEAVRNELTIRRELRRPVERRA
jgi:hypothetical protein